ncbi:hypothetical protein B6V74_16805 [Thioclava sp. F42-5]|uniref:hypothetical protein n=1 Tax=Thioclava sp. F42-5 TaxID=1973005 RepID=UPI000B543349|nr:hypothetical protein [Thioclava sp. F42-5]OWY07609.1 hypothetical protein B6V74_16805 [Thioclava sp. F42-5]
MHDADFVYLDFRFQEAGWLEGIRLRLTGTVPDELVSSGVRNQVFEVEREEERKIINITNRCLALTEPKTSSLSKENCEHLARVLVMKGFSADWLRSERADLVLRPGTLLDDVYRKELIDHLCSA